MGIMAAFIFAAQMINFTVGVAHPDICSEVPWRPLSWALGGHDSDDAQ